MATSINNPPRNADLKITKVDNVKSVGGLPKGPINTGATNNGGKK